MRGLKDKRVLITGAGQGIGRATALRFAEEGAVTILNDLEYSPALKETTNLIARQYGASKIGAVVAGDVASEKDVEAIFATAITKTGHIDVLINNAGINREHASHEYPIAVFDQILNVNLRGAFICAKLAIVHFLERGYGGVILNNSSNHEIVPKPRFIAYAASKGGLGMLMRTLSLEYAGHGIRVNNVAPGATVTPLNQGWTDDARKRAAVESHIPLGRAAEAEEIAGVFAFLASDDARYITGQTLYVDGGLTNFPEYRENWAS